MSQTKYCASIGPGHRMHWIQALKACDPDVPFLKVMVVAVHGDGYLDIEGDDLHLTLWHHDPTDLPLALTFGGRAEWKPQFRTLHVVSLGTFHVAAPEQVRPCVPPSRQPAAKVT